MVVKKRSKPKMIGILLVILIMVMMSIYCYQNFYVSNNQQNSDLPVVEKEIKKEYQANLVMVGDALIHSAIYQDAKTGIDSYDFRPMLEKIKPLVASYDLGYYNQETILGGSELGLSNYPRFNSPYEVGDAFIDADFNLVSLATNHTMDKGEQGVLNSLTYWQQHKNVYKAGSYGSFEERDEKVIREVNGITYAFFSYTTWTNGLSTPSGKEYLNNVYSEELVKNDIERVRDEVDVVIVAMHWGTEYSTQVSPQQEQIATYLSSLGVDIVIGTHPHVIEPITYVGKTLVFYSLGNFISDQEGVERLTGLVARVSIHKTVEKEVTTIRLENVEAELLYTYSTYGRKRNFVVYPYHQLNEILLPKYREYYQKYRSIVTSLNNQVVMKDL